MYEIPFAARSAKKIPFIHKIHHQIQFFLKGRKTPFLCKRPPTMHLRGSGGTTNLSPDD
jgi:hypothetical protein